MANTRWLDRSQPQTLLTATVLLYLNAALAIITAEFLYWPGAVMILICVLSALGIANEKKAGYWLAVVAAGFGLYLTVRYFHVADVFNLIFFGALLALLLHPQSRGYRRVWFK